MKVYIYRFQQGFMKVYIYRFQQGFMKVYIYRFQQGFMRLVCFLSEQMETHVLTLTKVYIWSAIDISQGVPQGSILGTLFFLLSANNLPLQDSPEGLSLFADDTSEFAHVTDVKSGECPSQIRQVCAKNVMLYSNVIMLYSNVIHVCMHTSNWMLTGSKQKLRSIHGKFW